MAQRFNCIETSIEQNLKFHLNSLEQHAYRREAYSGLAVKSKTYNYVYVAKAVNGFF